MLNLVLVGLDKNGNTRLGSDWKRMTHKKTLSGWYWEAMNMKQLQNAIEYVYCISYTQDVCELSEADFIEYVKTKGTKVL